MKKTLLLLTSLLFCTEIVLSQGFYNKNRNRNLVIFAGTGTTHYYGDLAKKGDNSNIQANLGIGARYNFYRWFSAGAEVTWLMLKGNDNTDPGKITRNLSFQSHNFEASGLMYVSLFEEDRRFYMRTFANPYIFGGVGVLSYNPTAKLDGEKYNLRKLKTEAVSYSGIAAVFPLGAGIKFRVNPFLNVALDGAYRFVMTDYLDDVSSGQYPKPASFTDETARKLSDRTWELGVNPTWAEQGKHFRGNPDNRDGYFIFNIKVEYYLSEIGHSSTYRKRIRGGSYKRLKPPKRRTNSQINRKRF